MKHPLQEINKTTWCERKCAKFPLALYGTPPTGVEECSCRHLVRGTLASNGLGTHRTSTLSWVLNIAFLIWTMLWLLLVLWKELVSVRTIRATWSSLMCSLEHWSCLWELLFWCAVYAVGMERLVFDNHIGITGNFHRQIGDMDHSFHFRNSQAKRRNWRKWFENGKILAKIFEE